MEMNLVVDIGNTRVKAALFEKKELTKMDVFLPSDISSLIKFIEEENGIKNVIFSSVVGESQEMINEIQKHIFSVIVLSSATKIPIINLYKTPETLGNDRLAAAIGAHSTFPNQNVLSIDCGTCIKYDFINSSEEYLGGAISLGLNMRLGALNHFTSRLPLIESDFDFDGLIGQNTTESILSGTLTAAAIEVDGTIEKYREQFPDLKVVLTGGDMLFFEKRLKNTIFADPYLVLKGLNEILEYNIR